MMRQTWIDEGEVVPLTWQSRLAGAARAVVYARQKPKLIAVDDEMLKRPIDDECTSHPFYDSLKMVVYLGNCGHTMNRKRAQRLMRKLDLQGMTPDPNTSRSHTQHEVQPYLRGVAIKRPNQVWRTDITDIRLAEGFAPLIDIQSTANPAKCLTDVSATVCRPCSAWTAWKIPCESMAHPKSLTAARARG